MSSTPGEIDVIACVTGSIAFTSDIVPSFGSIFVAVITAALAPALYLADIVVGAQIKS